MTATKAFYVYAWMRPCGEPFYIGKGTGKRDREFKRENTLFHRIVEKIKRSGEQPIILRVLDGLEESEALEIEKTLIRLFGRINKKTGTLANLTDGGEGVTGATFSHTAESRAKISAAMRGRTKSEETCAKLSASQKGKKRGSPREASREKMRIAKRMLGPSGVYKGVAPYGAGGKFRARINIGRVCKNIGTFETAEEAAIAYDTAAREAWGSDCYLNFPKGTC